MRYVDSRFTLTFLILELNLLGRRYARELRRRARDLPNVEFRPPVPGADVVTHGNGYDIGLFLMPPTNVNEEFSLANKVFQYVQSRLALAVSPLPEMKKLVDTYDVGVVSSDYSPRSMAETINALTPEKVAYYKRQSHISARALSADPNREKFESLVANVLAD
jgi:hypothetical protein